MKFELLNTTEQFEQLKKGDAILVKWNENFVRHTPKADSVMFYKIYENKYRDNEIICQKKYNHYFNYILYLEKMSAAIEVYKVTE